MSQVRKDVLNGWKEIAAYLGRDPRTVERWEKQRRLPVRRLPGGGRASVYALIPELDAWLARPPEEEPAAASQASQTVAEAVPDTAPLPAPELLTVSEALNTPEVENLPASPGELTHERKASRRPWLAVLAGVGLTLSGAAVTLIRHRHVHAPVVAGASATKKPEGDRIRTLLPSSQIPGVENLYLQGCYEAELRTPESLQRAEASFARAIARDPRYAPAYSGLGSTFLLLREYSMLSDQQAYSQALSAADEAIRLDPDFPQAHAVRGFVDFFGKWDPAKATQEFETAEHLEPTLAVAHHWYGSMLTHEGRFDEALRELQTAQKLDPASSSILTIRAYALGLSGHRDQGAELLRQAILTERPGQFRLPATMHQVLGNLSLLPPRDIPRFLSETLIAADLRHDRKTVRKMRSGTEVFHAKGETALWRFLLAEDEREPGNSSPSYAAARYKAALGQSDAALRDLQDLYNRHDASLIGLTIDPLLSDLHGESRFVEIRHRMGLPAVP